MSQFELATPWDVATATFSDAKLLPSWAIGQNPRGMWLTDGQLYLMRAEQVSIEGFTRAACM